MSETKKSIALGSDHAGLELKLKVIKYLHEIGVPVEDYGAYSDVSADYPDYAHKVSKAMEKGKHDTAILICGSGIGISITANRYSHIRCALCWMKEIASLSRRHNNANVLALPGRFMSESDAQEIVETFLNTEFEGGRHKTRVDKINCM